MPGSMTYRHIGIVGTGRVACAIGHALAGHSAEPVGIWGRNPAKCQDAVISVGRAHAAAGLADIAANCDLIILAVSDDALEDVTTELAAAATGIPSSFVVHVSGRSGVAILEPLRAAGFTTAAIHPAMTFTGDPTKEVRHMVDARFAVTGSTDQANAQACAIVTLLGGIPVEISENHRALYHAALCHAANHLVTLIASSCRALAIAGADEPAALLAPLVRAALDNSLDRGMAALSGPLLRGDNETVATHLIALEQDCPDLLPAYRAMALATLDELARVRELTSEHALRATLA